MRIATHILPGQFRKNPLYSLAGILVFFFLAYELSQYVLAGDIIGLVYIGIAFLFVVGALSMLNNWRTGTFIFFGWIFFEDMFRKYLGNNMAIYFAKDALVAVVYLSFFIAYRRKQVQLFRPPFYVPLLILVWFGFIQMFNPASTSIFYGIMGMKLYFYYIPLLSVGYAFVRSEADIQRFYVYLMVLTIIVTSLGIAQAILGHTFLNPAVIQEDIRDLSTTYRVSPITGLIVYRPTSVFVSTGRFTSFLTPAWLICFGFGTYLLLRSREHRFVTFLALASTTVAIALCASRGAVMWTLGSAIVCVLAFLWGCPWQRGQLVRVLRAFWRSFVVAVLALVLASFFYPEAIKGRLAFYWETLALDSSSSELVNRSKTYPLANLMLAFDHPRWPYGYGIGTASLGTQYVARIMHAPPMGIGVESGYGTLIVELGILGLFLWLVMSAALIVSSWKIVLKLRSTSYFSLGFVIFWYSFLFVGPYIFTGFAGYEDFLINSLFWFSLGILFRLPALHNTLRTVARNAILRSAAVQR